MPIYAYRCSTCGHAKDVLQKVSDPVLTTCPACGAETFQKQVTAAGFQLKGSGWYVTDFRGNGSAPAAKKDEAAAGDQATAPAESKSEPKSDAKADSKADGGTSTTAAAPPAPAPASQG
jgi:putative FmdB family regulatory protein